MWGLWLVVGLIAWFSVGFSTWHVHQHYLPISVYCLTGKKSMRLVLQYTYIKVQVIEINETFSNQSYEINLFLTDANMPLPCPNIIADAVNAPHTKVSFSQF